VGVCLAAWFGLAPLLQILHLTSSAQGHLFCQEHLQFEEAPEVLSDDLDRAPSELPALELGPGGESTAHQACALFCHHSLRESLLLPIAFVVGALAFASGDCSPEEASPKAGRSLICIAPKNSPPATAC